ncbi:hypothetical protein GGR56DRAFT_695140 [Xylariaceae sp. FL0804]|nr:hypothetical protein GGR56DRAFT_695140 [Xylariaceae sp. FL0804]
MASDGCSHHQEPLSVWNQIAPRVYISVVLIFPCDRDRREEATRHLQESLDRLGRECPLFAGRLRAAAGGSGRIVLQRRPLHDKIPFEVRVRAGPAGGGGGGAEADYAKMRAEGFPPAAFIDPHYAPSGIVGADDDDDDDREQQPLPVARVEVEFARGGLLLFVYLHHSMADGMSLRAFLEAFAAQTRRVPGGHHHHHHHYHRHYHPPLPADHIFRAPPGLLPPPPPLPPPPRRPSRCRSDDDDDDDDGDDAMGRFRRQVAQCPEYAILPDLSGPSQPVFRAGGVPLGDIAKDGRVFVFRHDRLMQLRRRVRAALIKNRDDDDDGDDNAHRYYHHQQQRPDLLPPLPSAYTTLAALAFAHVTRARALADDAAHLPPEPEPDDDDDDAAEAEAEAELWTAVNWRPRAFGGATDNYFGNAVLPAVARVPRAQVLAAAASGSASGSASASASGHHHHHHHHHDHNHTHDQQQQRRRQQHNGGDGDDDEDNEDEDEDDNTDEEGSAAAPALALARLVRRVKASLDAVDEAHVVRRARMLASAPDPRRVGVAFDPRARDTFAFNSWRHFGADVEWALLPPGRPGPGPGPGTPGEEGEEQVDQEVRVQKADAVRRAIGGWSLGTALLLPTRGDAAAQELFVSLEVGAMRVLCDDAGWMRWVDRVIG